MWIVSNFLSHASARLAFNSDPTMRAIAPWFTLLDGVFNVLLAALAVTVVRFLTARQERKARIASFA